MCPVVNCYSFDLEGWSASGPKCLRTGLQHAASTTTKSAASRQVHAQKAYMRAGSAALTRACRSASRCAGQDAPHCSGASSKSLAGLAIYAARGLQSGTAEITAVVFTTTVAGYFFEKSDAEIGHLPGGFKCEFGGGSRVLQKSVSMRKLNLRELNAQNCVNERFVQRIAAIPRQKNFCGQSSGKKR